MTNLFTILSWVATILTIATYIWQMKKSRNVSKWVKILNLVLLFTIAVLSSFYYKTIDAEQRAKIFYARYADNSFDTDFDDSKIRVVVTDGMVIFYDLGLDEKYPVLANQIEQRYISANAGGNFDRSQYVMIARDLFGIFGSISGELFDVSYLNGSESYR